MARLLLIAGVIFAIYLLLRAFKSNKPELDAPLVAEDMVQCAHCGVHLPKSESIEAGGCHFCNAAHRDAFKG
jgi:uncharacterized protein